MEAAKLVFDKLFDLLWFSIQELLKHGYKQS